MNQYFKIKNSQEIRKRKGKWLICNTCGDKFYVVPSRLKRNQVKYCSMNCYKKTGISNPFWGKNHNLNSIAKMASNPNRPKFTSEENPNKIRFGENFSGKSKEWWQRWFKRNVGKCEVCSLSDTRILQVHHKNGNKKDNRRGNLKYLCPNCHAITHYEQRMRKLCQNT